MDVLISLNIPGPYNHVPREIYDNRKAKLAIMAGLHRDWHNQVRCNFKSITSLKTNLFHVFALIICSLSPVGLLLLSGN